MKKIILCILSSFSLVVLGQEHNQQNHKKYIARVSISDILRDQAHVLKAYAVSGAVISYMLLLRGLKQNIYSGINTLVNLPR